MTDCLKCEGTGRPMATVNSVRYCLDPRPRSCKVCGGSGKMPTAPIQADAKTLSSEVSA